MLQNEVVGLPPWVSRRLITVTEYYKMAESGILTPEDRVELIEGQIVKMAPIGSGHAGQVNRLTRVLVTSLGSRAVISVQNPVRLTTFLEPEPDVAVLKPRPDDYSASHPTAADVLLLVEVADTSLYYDRAVKAALYARHGVIELWIVDLQARLISVYRKPDGRTYTSQLQVAGSSGLTIDALPGVELRANDIFGEG